MKQRRYGIILSLIVIAQLISIIYWGNIKEGYHIDEIYSYGLSNSYYAPFMESNGDYWNEWHDSEYLKNYVTVSEDQRFSYDSVYYNQTQDVHPFMYYFIIHTICSFFPGVFSKWFAIFVNCVFSALTLIVLYNIAKKLLKGGKVEALLLCFAYALSAGAISNAVYLRMYVMVTFLTALYVYLHILLYEGKKMYVPVMMNVIIGGLTHYYFYIFAFFISAFYCIYKLVKRQYGQVIIYAICEFISIGINIIIYPSTLQHMFYGYRGQEAAENLKSIEKLSKITEYIPFINMELIGGLLKYIVAIVAVVIIILFVRKCVIVDCDDIHGIAMHILLKSDFWITQKTYIIMSLAATVFCYFIIVTDISTIVANRYIFCLYPAILMLLFMLLRTMTEKCNLSGEKYLVLALCISVIVTVSEYSRGYVDYLYLGYEETADNLSEYSELDVLYVSDEVITVYRDMMFLDRAERFMPLKYDDFEETLEGLYSEKNAEGIVVYVYKEHDPQKALDILHDKLDYNEFTQIATTYQSNVYLCR